MATKVKNKKKKNSKKPIKKNNIKNKKNQKVILGIVAVLLVIALVGCGLFANNAKSKSIQKTVDFGKEVAVGADISHHNGNVDFSKLKDEVDFVIIRVGYRGYGNGKIYLDKKAKNFLKQAKKYNIPAGVYFYTQAITEQEAVEEAKFTLNVIKNYDVTLPVFYDFEYASSKSGQVGRLKEAKLNIKQNTALVKTFCKTINDAGYMSGVYASGYMFRDFFNSKDFYKNMYLWVADYNDKMTYNVNYDIWQYTSKGKLKATGNKKVDLNYWYQKQVEKE